MREPYFMTIFDPDRGNFPVHPGAIHHGHDQWASSFDGTLDSFLEDGMLFAVLLIASGALWICLSLYLPYRALAAATYEVTNQRLYIVKKKSVIPMSLVALHDFTIQPHHDGTGTIKSNPYIIRNLSQVDDLDDTYQDWAKMCTHTF